jgi:hypothetical protein
MLDHFTTEPYKNTRSREESTEEYNKWETQKARAAVVTLKTLRNGTNQKENQNYNTQL